jgi:DNA-binding HxlR family transcriptional regulator
MNLLGFLFGRDNGSDATIKEKLEELSAQIKKLQAAQKEASYNVIKEIRDLRAQELGGREELLKRVESVQEKLQFATEEYIATDEDVKQMIRNCLKSGAKTFNEIQKETKISPQSLQKYLHMMRNEIEEFNGVYRIVFSSSTIYVGRNGMSKGSDDDRHLLELVEADSAYDSEFEEP